VVVALVALGLLPVRAAPLEATRAEPASAPVAHDQERLRDNPAAAPTVDEVEEVLRELERESAAAGLPPPLSVTPSPGPAGEVPWWGEMVTPVLELRLRPMARLGHPTSRDRPEVSGALRGRVGADFHVSPEVRGRLVLSANQVFPGLRAPGPDLVHDAWVAWSYAAFGGTFTLRAGRQGLARSSLVAWGDNDFQVLEPRLDGLFTKLEVGSVFLAGVAVAEAARDWPSGQAPAPVNAAVMVQGGVEEGTTRQVEVHALARVAGLPVHGSVGPQTEGAWLVVAGGNAQWDWQGLSGRLAVDLQQNAFTAPTLYVPTWAAHASAGYAPPFPWAQGLYAQAGARTALGRPLTYLPGVSRLGVWDNVETAEVDPYLGTWHGQQGEMDLVGLTNVVNAWARLGMRRGMLHDLSVTLHHLSLANARGAWQGAGTAGTYLRPREGSGDPKVGWEVDLLAKAAVSRHVLVGGCIALLVSEAKAREAGFSAFAQTAYATLELKL
jgi:hypothetical protein